MALAQLLAEQAQPPDSLASERLIASRLLEFEIWTTLNARGLSASHRVDAERLIARIELVDLAPETLARALRPFPVAVRTLDGLHLATMDFLRAQRQDVSLGSYDRRMNACAKALGFPLYPL